MLDLVGVQEIRRESGIIEPAGEHTSFYRKVNENNELGTVFFVHRIIIAAVKKVKFVSNRISYKILRGRWCHIIVLNVNLPIEDKTDDMKESFYKELESVFDKFIKKNTQILLSEFNVKVCREGTFKLTIGNESLHEIINDNKVRVVHFATAKNLGQN
jgi:hypothetical protein